MRIIAGLHKQMPCCLMHIQADLHQKGAGSAAFWASRDEEAHLLRSLCKCLVEDQLGMRSGHVNEVNSAAVPGRSLKMKSAISSMNQQLMALHCQARCSVPVHHPRIAV